MGLGVSFLDGSEWNTKCRKDGIHNINPGKRETMNPTFCHWLVMMLLGATLQAAGPNGAQAQGVMDFDKTDPAVIERMTSIAFEAARSNDVKTIDAYLREGFAADVRSDSKDTLLSVAAYSGSRKVVKRLLEVDRINVDAPGRMGLTALAAASFKGETEILSDLLAAGANANAVNKQGQTALMFAALTGKVDAVRLLLKAGADPKRVDSAGNSAASLASKQGASRVLDLLPSP